MRKTFFKKESDVWKRQQLSHNGKNEILLDFLFALACFKKKKKKPFGREEVPHSATFSVLRVSNSF